MRLLIKNGHVIDPAAKLDEISDILIDGGRILQLQKKISDDAATIIDASGLIVCPGLVDIHCHLREPGFSSKETMETGCRAAIKGGYTSICAMPNTAPIADNASVLTHIKDKASRTNLCHVYPIGAITKEEKGQELAPMGEMRANGAVAFSDDGRPIEKASIMRLAADYAKIFDCPLITHCEDLSLTENGVINEGAISTRLGLKGIPAAAEEIMVARDIIIAEHTRAPIHFAHLSTAGSVQLVRDAKKRGIPVTSEVTPHHFSLSEELLQGFDPIYKVNPPLRTPKDIEELIKGLQDGTIDAIATDHAPHTRDEKAVEIAQAPFGIAGLETAFSVGITYLYKKGLISLSHLIHLFTDGPSQILNLPAGTLAPDACADILIFNPDTQWLVDESKLETKAQSSPYAGQQLYGCISYVICAGNLIFTGGKV